jgi:hypothetical protein
MKLRSVVRLSLLAALPIWAAAHAACAGKKGGLMLAINTDMKAPKDVNVVSVHIQTGSAVKHNFIGRVTPEGEVGLPATLAIAEPDDPNQSIRVRVVAFQENKPRVLRDVRTTVPRDGRIALLRIPLAFVNDGISVSGSLPDKFLPPRANGGPVGSGDAGVGIGGGGDEINPYDPTTSGITPGCADPDQTYIDGACQDSFIDPATLPDFSEEAVFGQGGAGACFDAKKCFANASPVGSATGDAAPRVDAGVDKQNVPGRISPQADRLDLTSCKITLDPGKDISKLNLAMVTKDTGECLEPGKCFIPLDQGERGWRVEGGAEASAVVSLPPIVCTLVSRGIAQIYASFGACSAKTPANPLCLDTAPAPPAPTPTPAISLMVPEGFVSALAIDGTRAVFAGGSGGGQSSLAIPSRQGVSTVPPMNVPWIITLVAGGDTLFTNTTTSTTYRESGQQATELPGAPTIRDVGVLPGRAAYWATGSGGQGKIFYEPTAALVTELGGIPFVGTPTHLLIAQQKMFVADEAGGLTTCTLVATGGLDVCQPREALSLPAIDSVATASGAPTVSAAYFSARGAGVHRLTLGPPATVTTLTTDDTTGVQGEQYFRRQIATDGACVYYATSQGLFWTRTDGSRAGKLGDVPGKPILAVAVAGPGASADVASTVYFAVYGELGGGGGIYRAGKPTECIGVGGGGELDAGR